MRNVNKAVELMKFKQLMWYQKWKMRKEAGGELEGGSMLAFGSIP